MYLREYLHSHSRSTFEIQNVANYHVSTIWEGNNCRASKGWMVFVDYDVQYIVRKVHWRNYTPTITILKPYADVHLGARLLSSSSFIEGK